MKLYKVTNGVAEYYVVAEHPTEAEEKLTRILTDYDYGLFSARQVTKIVLIATAIDNEFLTGKFLVL